MKTGQRSYIPGVGYIRIESVEEVELDALTEEDAQLDGFSSVAALQKEIQELYPPEDHTRHRTFRVRFSLMREH